MTKLNNKARLRQWLACGALAASGLFGGSQALAVDAAHLIAAEGIVREVSVAQGQLVITGIRYDVEPHLDVKIRGVVSSIAALEVGMKVSFVYRVLDEFDAQIAARDAGNIITQLEQLPDSAEVLEY